MKATLLFLLLLNALFWSWARWVAEPPGARLVASAEPDAKPLQLYREAYPDEAQEELDVTSLAPPVDETSAAALPSTDASVAQPGDQNQPPTNDADSVELAAEPPVDVATVLAAATTDDMSATQETPSQRAPESDAPVVAPPAAVNAPASEPIAAATKPADDEPVQTEPVTLAALESPNARCVALGPFVGLRETSGVAAKLRELGMNPAQRIEEDAEIWIGHWVYLPSFATRAAAVAEVERLRANDVTDVYIESSGPDRNAVSLGLFSNPELAEVLAGRIRKLDTKPQIRDRYRVGSAYWVDFTLPEGQDIDLSQIQTSPGRPAQLTDRECHGAL